MVLSTTIDGLKLAPKNRAFIASIGGRMGEAAKTKKHRALVALRVRAMVGTRVFAGVPRVTLTRLSAGTLDRGGLWECLKAPFDGLADGLGLADDRELQERATVAQEKCARGSCGLRISIEVEGET